MKRLCLRRNENNKILIPQSEIRERLEISRAFAVLHNSMRNWMVKQRDGILHSRIIGIRGDKEKGTHKRNINEKGKKSRW